MKSSITVGIVFNGRNVNVVANQHTYAPNEKSNGQPRLGWNYSGKAVFEVKSDEDKMLVNIEGSDYLVTGGVSNGGNWNYHIGGKQTIDGVEYQVGMNVTACKSGGKRPTGLWNFQVGINITPIFRTKDVVKPVANTKKGKKELQLACEAPKAANVAAVPTSTCPF